MSLEQPGRHRDHGANDRINEMPPLRTRPSPYIFISRLEEDLADTFGALLMGDIDWLF